MQQRLQLFILRATIVSRNTYNRIIEGMSPILHFLYCDDHRQWDTVHFFPVPGNARAARRYAPADGVSSPGRQQLHRTVPSQLEGRGSLDGGVQNRTPHEAFLAFAAVLKNEALTV